MQKNILLDYEQVLEQLNLIVKKGVIKKADDIGQTSHGLPISHYTVGNGKKHIVITAATHGSEIITTDFVLKLMNEISSKKDEWGSITKNFTIDFIPMLNPEGYLISTSAIRAIIPRDMPSDVAEKLCKEYYTYYKHDDNSHSLEKKHQQMFKDVDYTCISEKYSSIRSSVKDIFEKYPDLPKGCLQTWSANGNGIDIQANTEYNPTIKRILNNETVYMKAKRYNNIEISHPGPINCPFDASKGEFCYEPETASISAFLKSINDNEQLFAYLNYHSAGGMVFQRPAIKPNNINLSEEDLFKKELFNYIAARLYSEKTVCDEKSKKRYSIYPKGLPLIESIKDKSNNDVTLSNSKPTSLNDILRLQYQLDLLIELSSMGGNPIGPYGDLKGNYNNVITSNIEAVKFFLENVLVIKDIVDVSANLFTKYSGKSRKSDDEKYKLNAELLDYIYIEFYKKISRMGGVENKNYEER